MKTEIFGKGTIALILLCIFIFFIFLDSDASDEQQYLLTAASMVGEAVDDLVSSLTRENASEFD